MSHFETNKQTNRQTDRQTNKQTNKQTNRKLQDLPKLSFRAHRNSRRLGTEPRIHPSSRLSMDRLQKRRPTDPFVCVIDELKFQNHFVCQLNSPQDRCMPNGTLLNLKPHIHRIASYFVKPNQTYKFGTVQENL